MSGTSADGIDTCLAEIDEKRFVSIGHHFHPYSSTLKSRVESLFTPSPNEIDHLGELNVELAEHYSQAVLALLNFTNTHAEDVIAIGNHGQTVRHRPNAARPFTLQLGCSTRLATTTKIPVISDFRTADIALGGQGAPLVPAFHKAIFGSHDEKRGILNIGGIANITIIDRDGETSGWDIGPGNGLMDAWIQQNLKQPYDKEGHWAASGTSNEAALSALLNHPYFSKQAPKSTGKEEFTLDWALANTSPMAARDLQATLLMLTCKSIQLALNNHAIDALYVCGGGALNQTLFSQLQQQLPMPVKSTASLGIPPMQVEALAFAWLAYRFNHNLTGNLPKVTGASRATVLGTQYLPK